MIKRRRHMPRSQEAEERSDRQRDTEKRTTRESRQTLGGSPVAYIPWEFASA